MAKPTRKVVKEVCSLCGLDWKRHGEAPSAETCVTLLLAEVALLKGAIAARPSYPAIPHPVPSNPRPFYPHWYTTEPRYLGGATAAGSGVTLPNTFVPNMLSLTQGTVT